MEQQTDESKPVFPLFILNIYSILACLIDGEKKFVPNSIQKKYKGCIKALMNIQDFNTAPLQENTQTVLFDFSFTIKHVEKSWFPW